MCIAAVMNMDCTSCYGHHKGQYQHQGYYRTKYLHVANIFVSFVKFKFFCVFNILTTILTKGSTCFYGCSNILKYFSPGI
jgi:hypothetical protein